MLQFFADLWTERSPLVATVLAGCVVGCLVGAVVLLLSLARGEE